METFTSNETFKSALEKVAGSSDGNMHSIVFTHLEKIESLLKQGHTISSIARNLTDYGFPISRHVLGYHIKKARKNSLGLDAKQNLPKITTGSVMNSTPITQPSTQTKVKTIVEYRETQKHLEAVALSVSSQEEDLPEEVTRHKYINVKGKELDVTKMNIEDYITVAKNYMHGETIPDELGDTVMEQNLIRNRYERALKNFGMAITEYQRSQKLNNLNN